jgi:hypothetical protein
MRPDRAFFGAALTPAAVPAVLAVAVLVVFGAKDAGYPATVWYPGTLFVLALLTLAAIAGGGVLHRLSRPALVSVAFLAGLTAWTYLSILWSGVKADAWDGANRGLLYLVLYVLFVTIALGAESAALLLAGYALAVTGLGLFEFVAASRAADPDSYFLLARFSEPTGYQNANCALFAIAFWPALFLASRREVPLVLRALMLGSAGALAELGLLSQSRGWVAAMPITFVLFVALVPGRVRSLVFALPVGLALLAAHRPLLDVFSALQSGQEIQETLVSARTAIVVSALVLVALGGAMAAVDRALDPERPTTRRLARAAAAVFASGALVALIAGLVWLGNPVTRVTDAWHEFSGDRLAAPSGSYFSVGFGSARYDLWRVALREIEDEPVVGVGSDNFAVDYLRERRTDEEPQYPHSLELKILAQTGFIGAALFAGFLISALVAFAVRRTEPAFARALRAGALVGFAYWFVHGSVDWFWELPGLAGPAFAMLGIAVASPGPADRVSSARRRRAVLGVGVIVLLAAVVSLTLPWISAKEVQAAGGSWERAPRAAFDRLDRARALNPLSDRPDVIRGVIAGRRGDTRGMVVAFGQALERNPDNWYSHLELAAAYARLDRRAAALRELRLARRLNPLEPTIPLVESRVRRGQPVSLEELDRTFLDRTFVSNRTRPK